MNYWNLYNKRKLNFKISPFALSRDFIDYFVCFRKVCHVGKTNGRYGKECEWCGKRFERSF